jgi:siroheme synthase
MPQGDINQLLVELAREGLSVVRLKGGDPFIFGRGGEELETLAASGIPSRSSRRHGSSRMRRLLRLPADPPRPRPGRHLRHRPPQGRHGQSRLAGPGPPLPDRGFYMGIGAAEEICRQMINHGLPSLTPAAVVRNGTQADQRTVLATLGTLPQRIAESGIKPPALIVVGSVVGLHEKLSWFEKQ